MSAPKVTRTRSLVLLRAALILTERGWCQDTMRGPAGRVDVLGAIWAAAAELDDSQPDRTYGRARDHLGHYLLRSGDKLTAGCPIVAVVQYNDAAGRTMGQVQQQLAGAAHWRTGS